MVIPKSVSRRIENQLKTFLWANQGQQRLEWVSWKAVCAPPNECGLGIRSLSDTIHGCQGKLAWKVYSRSSLWARVLQQKYGMVGRHGNVNLLHSASRLWKKLFPNFQKFQHVHLWKVGKGDIYFWRYNWLDEVLNPAQRTELTVRQGLTDHNVLRQVLSPSQYNRAMSVVLDTNREDEMMFTAADFGMFMMKGSIDLFRTQRPKVSWYSLVWNSILPNRINGFRWRLFSAALPLDERVHQRGVMLASKCSCCRQGNIESIDHLFVGSDVAQWVWCNFAKLLYKLVIARNIQQLFKSWLQWHRQKSHMAYVVQIILFTGCWELWKSRCRKKFEEIDMDAQKIISRIYSHLTEIGRLIPQVERLTHWERTVSTIMAIQIRATPTRRGKWLAWAKPPMGILKMKVS